jgi:hypothetical protein
MSAVHHHLKRKQNVRDICVNMQRALWFGAPRELSIQIISARTVAASAARVRPQAVRCSKGVFKATLLQFSRRKNVYVTFDSDSALALQGYMNNLYAQLSVHDMNPVQVPNIVACPTQLLNCPGSARTNRGEWRGFPGIETIENGSFTVRKNEPCALPQPCLVQLSLVTEQIVLGVTALHLEVHAVLLEPGAWVWPNKKQKSCGAD